MFGANGAARGFNRHDTIVFSHFVDRTVSEKGHAILTAGLCHPGQVFEGMKSRLPGIAQNVAALAPFEGYAHQPVDGSSDLADRIHFLVDDIGRHVPPLKEIAVKPAKVAVDLLYVLDFLDAVDGSRLAVAKELCRLVPPDLRHFADEIVAQRSKVSRRPRRHATANAAAVDDNDGPAALVKLIRR